MAAWSPATGVDERCDHLDRFALGVADCFVHSRLDGASGRDWLVVVVRVMGRAYDLGDLALMRGG